MEGTGRWKVLYSHGLPEQLVNSLRTGNTNDKGMLYAYQIRKHITGSGPWGWGQFVVLHSVVAEGGAPAGLDPRLGIQAKATTKKQ